MIQVLTIGSQVTEGRMDVYIERRWNCGAVVDVQKVMPRRQIPKGKRAPRQNPTPQAVAAYNEKLARWKLSRILNAAFGLGDQHLILTYRQEDRPAAPEGAKARVRDYLGQVRRFFRARGLELKYVHVPAVSKRGVPHHHLVLNTGTLSPEDRRGCGLCGPGAAAGGWSSTPMISVPWRPISWTRGRTASRCRASGGPPAGT